MSALAVRVCQPEYQWRWPHCHWHWQPECHAGHRHCRPSSCVSLAVSSRCQSPDRGGVAYIATGSTPTAATVAHDPACHWQSRCTGTVTQTATGSLSALELPVAGRLQEQLSGSASGPAAASGTGSAATAPLRLARTRRSRRRTMPVAGSS